jgi:hypothetical protein
MEAALQLHLPHRDGVASMYCSACCTERAVEIQNSVQDMIALYREKLGVGDPLALAGLDGNDWDRVMQRTTAFRFPYGLTSYYPVAPFGYILFIPADDNGVITQHLLGAREHATPATLKVFASAHLTYDEEVHRVTLQTSYHEAGHTLVYKYGIGKTNYFQNEILVNYFAHAYTKARDPQTATVEEGSSKCQCRRARIPRWTISKRTVKICLKQTPRTMTGINCSLDCGPWRSMTSKDWGSSQK